jgi:hypothetical protein
MDDELERTEMDAIVVDLKVPVFNSSVRTRLPGLEPSTCLRQVKGCVFPVVHFVTLSCLGYIASDIRMVKNGKGFRRK